MKRGRFPLKKLQTKYYVVYSLIIAIGIALDQITKWLSTKYLTKIPTLPLIEDVLHLTYVENRGAAFGMLADHRWVFLVISSIAILAIGFYLYSGRAENMLYGVAFSLICSGGIGNMIDRIALGYVVDFIDFRLINFAVFNGADSFVCIGAGLLILELLLDLIKEIKRAKAEKK